MKVRELLDGHNPTAAWLATPAAQRLLRRLPVRRDLYKAILTQTRDDRSAAQAFAPLARALLPHEVRFRSTDDRDPDDTDGNGFENIYQCALVLFDVGQLVDVMPLYRAKLTDFDTGLGMDGEFLIGAGLRATKEHVAKLAAAGEPRAADLLKYLGLMDDQPARLEEWRAWRYRYHLGEE
ncbi:MAG: hypothetical protein JNL12_05140 [Planctomycetes bacterium]|nr:hypothetical protein [Planctomycetota bacterium]